MNKWTYKNVRWLYLVLISIRMDYFIFIGQKGKAKQIITEHIKWEQ